MLDLSHIHLERYRRPSRLRDALERSLEVPGWVAWPLVFVAGFASALWGW